MNDPKYADYFLFGRFGEICTMCEVVVLCEVTDADTARETIPESGSFTIYHIRTRTFWSQIATIWEWFIRNFDDTAADGHERPVLVYEVVDGKWPRPRTVRAQVSLEPPVIALHGHEIDRTNRRWHRSPELEPVGYCQRLPLWESIEIIDARRPSEFPL
ncbi:MAG: hypothetical protein JSV45_14010 [Chromatiales bacterium]|nr:MAG: hypothetical protein JSV45_14010 [Chromatiales bacterium]